MLLYIEDNNLDQELGGGKRDGHLNGGRGESREVKILCISAIFMQPRHQVIIQAYFTLGILTL